MNASSPQACLQALLPQLFESNQIPGEPYLRFQLTTEITALFAMSTVQESLLVEPSQITPLPNLPLSVMGIMSSRNRVFCVLELAEFLQLPSVATFSQRYQVVVVRAPQSNSPSESELLLGITVGRIQGITRLTAEKLESPLTDFPATLTPYLMGCVAEGEQKLLALDVRAIIRASSQLSDFPH